MRLLYRDLDTGLLRLTKPYIRQPVPEYTILSHTWLEDDEQEVTFDDIVKGHSYQNKNGYRKLEGCLAQTEEDGYKYTWMDTCCINRSHPDEVSRAINSMYAWYSRSRKCYAYLADVVDSPEESGARKDSVVSSRWFTRGWTLQELLGSPCVEFYSDGWTSLGNKIALAEPISQRTGVPTQALTGATPINRYTMKTRLRWGRDRETMYEEDQAYCMIGLLGVSMSLSHGESKKQAMSRLREAMILAFRDDLDADHSSEEPHPQYHAPPKTMKERVESIDLLKLLAFGDMRSRRMQIDSPYCSTDAWIFDDPVFNMWRTSQSCDHDRGFLWIKGKPGAGKSTIVRSIDKSMESQDNATHISFYFHARGTQLQKNLEGMYRSLLTQLLEHQGSSPHSIIRKYVFDLESVVRDKKWPMGLLQTLLRDAFLECRSKLFTCFVDALDECDVQEVQRMIEFFETVADSCASERKHLRICFASRHYPIIRVPTELELDLDRTAAHQTAIEQYIERKLHAGNDEIDTRIRGDVYRKAQGVFLWAVLVVNILNQEYLNGTSYNVHKRPREIPPELGQLFNGIIAQDDEASLKRFQVCIIWILFARRPLHVRELCWFIAESDGVRFDDYFHKPEVYTDMCNLVLSSSKGLVEISPTDEVQFVHETVREHFLSDAGIQAAFGNRYDASTFADAGHEHIWRACQRLVHSWRNGGCEAHPSASAGRFDRRGWTLQLRHYFMHNAHYHIKKVQGAASMKAILSEFDFVQWHMLFPRPFRLSKLSLRFYHENIHHGSLPSPVDVLAWHGMTKLLDMALASSMFSESSTKPLRLLYAAMTSGSPGTLRLVLDYYGILVPDVVLRGISIGISGMERDKWNPLMWALRQRRVCLAFHLITSDYYIQHVEEFGDLEDFWSAADCCGTDLEYETDAARAVQDVTLAKLTRFTILSGNVDSIGYLLAHCEVSSVVVRGSPVLALAARHWHLRDVEELDPLLRVLIEHGADIDAADNTGRTAHDYLSQGITSWTSSGFKRLRRSPIHRHTIARVRTSGNRQSAQVSAAGRSRYGESSEQ